MQGTFRIVRAVSEMDGSDAYLILASCVRDMQLWHLVHMVNKQILSFLSRKCFLTKEGTSTTSKESEAGTGAKNETQRDLVIKIIKYII